MNPSENNQLEGGAVTQFNSGMTHITHGSSQRASSSASECHSTCWNPCFLQLPSTSSSHAAPDHDATTTMLDCRQGTIFLVLLTRASPHMLGTIWVKQVHLRLTRPQDMVPVIHALGQVVFSKLIACFLWASFRRGSLLGQRPCKPTCCSVWRMVWALTSWLSTSATSKAMLAALMHLFFWSQLLHLTHSTRTQLLWSNLVRPVPSETRLGKPLFLPGHCTVTQFQAVTEILIA